MPPHSRGHQLAMTLLLGVLPFLVWGITTPDVNEIMSFFSG